MQMLPWLDPIYTPFEKAFDARAGFFFVHQNAWIPWVSVALYAAMILVLPAWSRDKQLKLNKSLAVWNLVLCVFSLVGAVRTVPHLLVYMATASFKDTVCTPPQMVFGDGATGLWCLLFTLSKVVELVDTLFVVLKGKQPIFLHWYHHVTVLLFTWFSYAARHPGIYFIAMNYSVHAFMYCYYFLMAIDAKPKWLK
jgi:elongation of very long chain fatty acids protein 6